MKLDLIQYSECGDVYKKNDKLIKKRTDSVPRMNNAKHYENLHKIINDAESDYLTAINRHVNYYLTDFEIALQAHFLKWRLPDSHTSFSDEFDNKIYPLFE